MIFIYEMIYKLLNKLFGKRWICEYCGDIQYSRMQPFCKPCCHVHRKNVKMFRIKK